MNIKIIFAQNKIFLNWINSFDILFSTAILFVQKNDCFYQKKLLLYGVELKKHIFGDFSRR
ncbi:MAG: hypothetical protein AMJ43_09540 [Coxiella sp. DG_40]|nr:MAG: hypothetical protein AMJ43_09540 [Coxiella sp. DG_40]